MLVQFEKLSCPKHHLPFEYICTNCSCRCTVRLCLRCAQDHLKKKDIQDDFIKEHVFSKKLEIETEIVAKQYSYLEKVEEVSVRTDLLDSRNQYSKQIVESTLLALNEEKKAIFNELQNLNFQLYQTKNKMKKLNDHSFLKYLSSIKSKQLIPAAINLSSEKGLQKNRSKAYEAQKASQKYQQLIINVQKYGTTTNQLLAGLGFNQERLLKSKIQIKKQSPSKKNLDAQEKARDYCNKELKNESTQKRLKGAQIRTNSPARKRKLSLVSAQKRTRTNSDKQN